MRTSTMRLPPSAVLRRRPLLMRSALVVILCAGVAQTGVDGIVEGHRHYGKRTLHVMDYGHALPTMTAFTSCVNLRKSTGRHPPTIGRHILLASEIS
jgi:hypothetical protein